MSKKDKIKNLLELEAIKGPILTLTIPLDPKLDDIRRNKTQINSLVETAHKAFDKNYKPELWHAYTHQIDNYLETLKPNASIADGLLMYVTPDSIQVETLNYIPQPTFHFSKKTQILPMIKNTQFNPDFDMLLLQKDDYKLYRVKDLNITDPKENVPDKFASDESETIVKRAPQKNDKELDTKKYYEEVDKYLQHQYSDKDKLPLILVANPEDIGEFMKVTHNPYIDKDNSVEQDPNLKSERKDLKDIAKKINKQFKNNDIKKVNDNYDEAINEKKATDNLNTIKQGAPEDQLANLIIQEDSYIPNAETNNNEITNQGSQAANLINDLALKVLSLDGKVNVLPKKSMPNNTQQIAAILRWANQ